MNANEVIAGIRGAERRDRAPQRRRQHVAVVERHLPTATHIAATEAAVRHLIPALEVLHESLAGKGAAMEDVVKSGRTHLMDAVPVTLGRSSAAMPGRSSQHRKGKGHAARLGELAIGGTAVGTGLNAPDGFGAKVVEVLVSQTGLAELRTAVNSFEAQAARDGLVRRQARAHHRRLH